MAARSAWYPRSRWYGDVADVNRPKPVLVPLREVMRKLALSATATVRLRMIVDSGATRQDPLCYRGRVPRGTLPLVRWSLVHVHNDKQGIARVWALQRGILVRGRLPKPAPLRRDVSTSTLVAALGGEPCT